MRDYPCHIVFVTGIIRNPMGELLMIKSTYRPGWEPPGGQVEIGEDLVLEGELVGGQAATSAESQAVGWFAPEQAMELITLDWMKERVEDALMMTNGLH